MATSGYPFKTMNQHAHSNRKYLFALVALATAVALINLAVWWRGGSPGLSLSQVDENSTTVTAQVVEIVEEDVIEVNNQPQAYQIVQVQVLEGRWAGQIVIIDYGKTQVAPPGISLDVGDKILVDFSQRVDGTWQPYFLDFVRTPAMFWLLALFVVSSILLSGWKGVRSLVAMFFSFVVIIWFILPRILQGDNPIAVSTVGAFMILATTLYLVYGWTLKTHAAVLGILIALSITGLLAYNVIGWTRLTGFGSEEAIFLTQLLPNTIDLRGLVLSGIVIGTLGVLDDLVITQTSAVFELHSTNPGMVFAQLFRRAMRIGQDHVAATVNTLVLAYTGAALPLLLLVSSSGEQFGTFINREFVAEEVARTLVGSFGLIAAVPITTGLACLMALHHGQLGPLRRYLGPVSLGEDHAHHHH
jgi:uncharacterized membrane protein